MLKINSVEINFKDIIKGIKRKETFDNNLLNIISNNSSFNVEKKEKPKEIIFSITKFDINILRPKKKIIELEKTHTDLSIITNISTNNIKKNDWKDCKIENVEKFLIVEKLSIEKKRSEMAEDSSKINLLFNDDTSTINTNKKMKDPDLDESIETFSTKDMRSMSIMINPKDLFESKDYYCLYQEEYVRRKLGHLNDICAERNIYSDLIYVLVEKVSVGGADKLTIPT